MKTIEEQIHELKFKGEEFNANDFNDWAKENEGEAYLLCKIISDKLNYQLEKLKADIRDEYNVDGSVYNLIERIKNVT